MNIQELMALIALMASLSHVHIIALDRFASTVTVAGSERHFKLGTYL